jgi:tetratricopeptide (TPR) repeat protein
MRVVPILTILACAARLCLAAEPLPKAESRALRRGSELEERGAYAEAKDIYLAGLRQLPKSAELSLRVGTLYLREGNWPEAIRYLRHARDLRPRHVDTLYYLAQACHLDGQYGPALEVIRRASELAPERADVAQKYGEYLCEGKLCQEGLRYLLKAQRLDPTLANIEFDLGMAYHRQSAVPEAQQHLEAALKGDPGNLVAARFLADVLHRQGEWATARDLYEVVIAREPQNAWALYGLGRALVALGKHEEALAPLRRSLAVDPTIGEAHFQLARALRQLGRHDEEQRELYLFKAFGDRKQIASPVVKAAQTPFESRIWEMCRRLLDENKEPEALEYLDSQLNADRAHSQYLLGVLCFSLKRSADAVRLLAQAAASSPGDAAALAFLGRAYVAQAQYDQAETTLARARALASNDELPLIGSAELEYARGHWDETIRYLEQSRTTQVPALLLLCRAYLLAGNRAKALEVGDLVRAYGRDDTVSLRALDGILSPDQQTTPPGAAALPPSP